MIRKIFNQSQIIKAIDRYRQDGESAQIILDSIKALNINKHPLEAIFPLQWILESLLKEILEKANIKPSNMISKNLKEYFKLFPNSILDRKKIEHVREIRNYFNHSGVIRDPLRMPIMINSYILAIEFIAMEAEVDLAQFFPSSSTDYIKKLAQESEVEIEDEPEKKRKNLIFLLVPLLIFMGYWLYQNHYKVTILTGAEDGTYYKMLTQLKEIGDENIDIIPSKGSVENLKKLGLKKIEGFGLVQNDVLEAFANDAINGQELQSRIIKNISVIKPLLKEEIHILVKADSNLSYFRDIKNKKIAIGSENSGNAITSFSIYEKLFHIPLKKKKYYQSFSNALDDLRHKQVDAIIVVGGEPLLKLQKPLKGIKLLSYEAKEPLEGYELGNIEEQSYPWLKSDTKTLMVTSFLLTNLGEKEKIPLLFILKNLKKSLEEEPQLKIHPKWREFDKQSCLPLLPNGVIYHSSTRVSNDYCK
jgi:hypothetical protein